MFVILTLNQKKKILYKSKNDRVKKETHDTQQSVQDMEGDELVFHRIFIMSENVKRRIFFELINLKEFYRFLLISIFFFLSCRH